MILVTGATGFIGKHLINALKTKEGLENVIAFVSKPIENGNYLLHNNYNISPGLFEKPVYKNIKTVIHAGAFTPKNGAQANDISQSFSNIQITINLINALPNSVKHFIFFSTLDIYGESDTPLSEQSNIEPSSLYGQSKLYCEKMVLAWGKEKQIKVSILRIGHTYGPGEEAYKKIIPICITRLQQNMAPQIWGSGNDLRSFIYVEDVINMVINTISLNGNEGPVNIVSEKSVSINELVKMLIEISGLTIQPEYISLNAKAKNLKFNASKMNKLLGTELTGLKEGLTVEWNYMLQLNK